MKKYTNEVYMMIEEFDILGVFKVKGYVKRVNNKYDIDLISVEDFMKKINWIDDDNSSALKELNDIVCEWLPIWQEQSPIEIKFVDNPLTYKSYIPLQFMLNIATEYSNLHQENDTAKKLWWAIVQATCDMFNEAVMKEFDKGKDRAQITFGGLNFDIEKR